MPDDASRLSLNIEQVAKAWMPHFLLLLATPRTISPDVQLSLLQSEQPGKFTSVLSRRLARSVDPIYPPSQLIYPSKRSTDNGKSRKKWDGTAIIVPKPIKTLCSEMGERCFLQIAVLYEGNGWSFVIKCHHLNCINYMLGWGWCHHCFCATQWPAFLFFVASVPDTQSGL